MDKQKRRAMIDAYKQQDTMMGVIQIKNNRTGKLYIAAYTNLKNKWLSITMQLNQGAT